MFVTPREPQMVEHSCKAPRKSLRLGMTLRAHGNSRGTNQILLKDRKIHVGAMIPDTGDKEIHSRKGQIMINLTFAQEPVHRVSKQR